MTNAINKNEVSMFKVGKYVVLNKSQHQNRVMKIEMFHEEFIRAYQIDSSNYSFAHMSNFRLATPEEIAAGHRIDQSIIPGSEGKTDALEIEEQVK
ncbi:MULTISPECIES: hypothetical protein [unclassified Acinetobacter]|uniref:hypothetical protein n=1 Tax=unclassified Acinetobacter TaxID=196816 RepID=UPI0020918638|nr:MULTISPECIES: hypothetical protein [unclassified Acinetobacter]